MPAISTCLRFATEAEDAARFDGATIPGGRLGAVLRAPPGGPAGRGAVRQFAITPCTSLCSYSCLEASRALFQLRCRPDAPGFHPTSQCATEVYWT